MIAFIEPWNKCNICKQYFQGQLLIDLASSCLSFAETTYGAENNKWDKLKPMFALRLKISAIFHATNDNHNETLQPVIPLINNLLSMVNQTKKDLNMSRWIHMPQNTEEYQYFRMLCGNYEAYGYDYLGRAYNSIEGIKTAIIHFKKARAIYNLVSMTGLAKEVENKIAATTVKMEAVANEDISNSRAKISSISELAKNIYENNLNEKGINAEATIQTGVSYARSLTTLARTIEAERFVTKLSAISRRVLGPEHKVTINAETFLNECKVRYVFVLPENTPFQALRYKNDGNICVVIGPITEPRRKDEERIHRIENNLILPEKGCPVLCHGLVSAPHLNGRLGEVRNVTR